MILKFVILWILVYYQSFSSLLPISITDRDKKISVISFAKRPEKITFIFALFIFFMLRYPRITFVFKLSVGFGLLSYMSTISVKIVTSAMSTQLYGSLLNYCTFLVIHKVKYCMVLSYYVWMHHFTIIRYTWQKKKATLIFFLIFHC